MSVAVGVIASEGIAMTTDSRRTQRRADPNPHYRVASDTAEKLFLAEDRFAVATYGDAMIGDQTIRGLMEQFEGPADAEVADYAAALGKWFQERLNEEAKPRRGELLRAEGLRWPLGFAIAGYEGGVGQIFDVKARPGDCHIEAAEPNTGNPGVVPHGQTDAIDRLLKGIDLRALEPAGIKLPKGDREKLDLLAYDLIHPQGVADAVDLAEFLVETQIQMQRFSDGTFASPKRVPGCGGHVRTVAVTRNGARWTRNAGEPLRPSEASRERSPRAAEAHAPEQRSA
jgi:hypothetical protein